MNVLLHIVLFLWQEFAEALKEFSPEHEGIKDAQHSIEELERLKHELEQKRKNQLDEAKKEQQGRVRGSSQYSLLSHFSLFYIQLVLNFSFLNQPTPTPPKK